jgi:hypothetical protein
MNQKELVKGACAKRLSIFAGRWRQALLQLVVQRLAPTHEEKALLIEIAVPTVGFQLFQCLLRKGSPITDLAVPFHISHATHPGNNR